METRPAEGPSDAAEESAAARKARRMKADQAERRDSLILYKIRGDAVVERVPEPQPARPRTTISTTPKRRRRTMSGTNLQGASAEASFDLAPEDVDRERLSGAFTYPEWDMRSGVYLPDHVRVLASPSSRLRLRRFHRPRLASSHRAPCGGSSRPAAGEAAALRPARRRRSRPRRDAALDHRFSRHRPGLRPDLAAGLAR